MLPLFNKVPAFRDRKERGFQVVVKAQRYEVEKMSGYSGHWHREGLTENIIIAGIWYFEKNFRLSGGNLRFRNTVGPSARYEGCAHGPEVDGERYFENGEIPIQSYVHSVNTEIFVPNTGVFCLVTFLAIPSAFCFLS
jgi:hypothetical protein